jgi:hypothetical protein
MSCKLRSCSLQAGRGGPAKKSKGTGYGGPSRDHLSGSIFNEFPFDMPNSLKQLQQQRHEQQKAATAACGARSAAVTADVQASLKALLYVLRSCARPHSPTVCSRRWCCFPLFFLACIVLFWKQNTSVLAF